MVGILTSEDLKALEARKAKKNDEIEKTLEDLYTALTHTEIKAGQKIQIEPESVFLKTCNNEIYGKNIDKSAAIIGTAEHAFIGKTAECRTYYTGTNKLQSITFEAEESSCKVKLYPLIGMLGVCYLKNIPEGLVKTLMNKYAEELKKYF